MIVLARNEWSDNYTQEIAKGFPEEVAFKVDCRSRLAVDLTEEIYC